MVSSDETSVAQTVSSTAMPIGPAPAAGTAGDDAGASVGDRLRCRKTGFRPWPEGAAMTTTTQMVPGYLDVTRLALASFLAN